jgi:ABC-type dipeptide/oligopeptide/nickel transport system permease component
MLLSVVANRVAMALLTLGVAVIVFILLRVVPGDPVAMMISPGAGPADIAALRAHYGLDASVPV